MGSIKVYPIKYSQMFKNVFQLTFTGSKSTIGALEKGVKYVQSGIIDVVLVFLLLTLNTFHTFF